MATRYRKNVGQALWLTPVIPASQEAEVGRSLGPRNSKLQWPTIMPLHSGIGNRVRLCLLKENNNNKKNKLSSIYFPRSMFAAQKKLSFLKFLLNILNNISENQQQWASNLLIFGNNASHHMAYKLATNLPKWAGAMAHVCNPSNLGGWGVRLTWI